MRAALVGPVQQESLPLQYLAGSVRQAGHEAVVVGYNGRCDLDTTLTQVLDMEPDLVGVSIAFQNSIEDYIVFVGALRERGYDGHVTCGGHVPTFCWAELLADLPGLDTVVRHDGEQTLVEMLDRLGAGQPVQDIAGLVWRDRGGGLARGPLRAAVGDLDSIPWPARSGETYAVGGITTDFVIAARGCVSDCTYCSIAAYTTEQQKRYRLRRPEAVADEIASLYHDRHARVLFFQDDLFVLPGEAATIQRVGRFTRALRARGVTDLAIWAKGAPQSITPAVCQALREMGVIHLFLGVESGSAPRLAYLGRKHQPEHNRLALAHCRAAGMVPSFNFMLFDPDTRFEDLPATLELADENVDMPWNVCRTEIYSGTALKDRLERERRLTGTYRSYGYRILDDRAEVLFRILRVSLREHAIEMESLLNRLIGLSFARQLHDYFFPGEATAVLSRQVIELCRQARRGTLETIREAMAFVDSEDFYDERRVREFAVAQALAVGERDQPLSRRTDELWQHLSLRGATLMQRRGVPMDARIHGGWGTIAGF